MGPRTYFLGLSAMLALGAVASLIAAVLYERRYVTIERTEYHAPKPPDDDFLKDDRLEDKPCSHEPVAADPVGHRTGDRRNEYRHRRPRKDPQAGRER